MKKIIICEGFNDGLFIESLMDKLGFSNNQIKIFNQASVSLEEKKHAETLVLRKFIDDNSINPYDFLVKLDGGNDSAVKLFTRELVHNLRKIKNLVLILDLDNSTFSGKKRLIKKMVDRSFGPTPLELEFKERNQNEHLHHSSCKVTVNGTKKEIGEFQMVLFKKSLEYSCGIKDGEKSKEKTKKIEKFIVESKVSDFFSPIINYDYSLSSSS